MAPAPGTAGSQGAALTVPFILALHLQQQEELVSAGAGAAPLNPRSQQGHHETGVSAEAGGSPHG